MSSRFISFIIFLFLLVNLFIHPFPVFAEAQSVMITELMVDPDAVSDAKGEWIEILNNSSVEISLNNWVINDDDEDHKAISGSYIIPPNGYAVICRDDDILKNGGVNCDYQGTMTLSNTNKNNNPVILKDSEGNSVDQIMYAKKDVDNAKGKSINISKNTSRTLFIETTHAYGAGDFGTPGKDPYNTKNISSKEFNPALFFSSGAFSLPDGITDEKNTTSVSINEEMTISVAMADGSHSVDLPSGIVITRKGGGAIDATKLSADNIETASLSGFTSGSVVEGGLQWGIPDVGLEFSQAVTLNIFVGTSKNGQTLNIMRSSNTNSDWTSEGIVSPGTCTVSEGLCTFQATKASYFATTTIAPTATPTPTATPASNSSSSSGSDSGSSNSSSQASPPTCDDAKPASSPILLSAAAGINSVVLNWSNALDPVTHYLLAYGREPGAIEFGNLNIGNKNSTSYTVYDLLDRTRYYFRIMAVNNCKPGEFSNELSAIPIGTTKSLVTLSNTDALGVARGQEIHETSPQKEFDPNNSQFGKDQFQPNTVSSSNIFSPVLIFFGAIISFFSGLLSS